SSPVPAWGYSSKVFERLQRRPALPRVADLPQRVLVAGGQLGRDVEALLDQRDVTERPERLGAPERAVDRTVLSRADQAVQVGVSRIHPRAARRARRPA